MDGVLFDKAFNEAGAVYQRTAGRGPVLKPVPTASRIFAADLLSSICGYMRRAKRANPMRFGVPNERGERTASPLAETAASSRWDNFARARGYLGRCARAKSLPLRIISAPAPHLCSLSRTPRASANHESSITDHVFLPETANRVETHASLRKHRTDDASTRDWARDSKRRPALPRRSRNPKFCLHSRHECPKIGGIP